MAFSRGKYGIEYHKPENQESHALRWILVLLAVLVTVSFVVARFRKKPGPPVLPPDDPVAVVRADVPVRQPGPADRAPRPPVAVESGTGRQPQPDAQRPAPADVPGAVAKVVQVVRPSKPATQGSPFAAEVDAWIASRTWSKYEQDLLVLLRDAEGRGNLHGARGAIQKLMYRPSVEDLKDRLVRRLGDLNTELLFSGTNTPWTATVKVKRGDTLQRIALEHKTTMEALQKLNPLKDPNRLALGQKLRVLNFPDADLVVHKQLQFADLMLKKQIFKRYYIKVHSAAEPGAYPVTNEAGGRATERMKALFSQLAPADRDELRIFLAPGSRITVTAQ